MQSVSGASALVQPSNIIVDWFSLDIYDKAFSTGLLQKSVEEIVPVVLARAGLIKRVILPDDEGM